ncbi:hypothetical protein [Nitrincola tapanii]|uniref:Uncharacterized protein n=1 Tax=Nitrincola tapanii TaxID=1708751 RepID=A0A5A9W6T0_9GAMM|nr:hypothetical protein [Nitrincola tapanii]KAA0876500.1 hypothetical protein E1H14_01895 [Nitrincola tapanii]
MRWIRRFLLLVLLLILIAATVYAYAYYRIKKEVDTALAATAPLVTLDYKGFSLDPRGAVRLTQLSLAAMGQAPIVIESLTLRSADPLFLLNPQKALNRAELPEHLSVHLRGLALDLNSPLFLSLDQMSRSLNAAEPGIDPAALGCGPVRRFDLTALRMMGMRQVQLDMDVSLRPDPSAGRLDLNLYTDLRSWWTTGLSVNMALPAAGAGWSPLALRVYQLSVDYQDVGFNRRRQEFCAAQAGTDVASYQANHQALLLQWLASQGVELSPALQSAYQALQTPNAQASVSLILPGGLGVADTMMSEADWMAKLERLRIQLNVNEHSLALQDEFDWMQWWQGYGSVPAQTTAGSDVVTSEVASEAESEVDVELESPSSITPEAVEPRSETPIRPQAMSRRFEAVQAGELPQYVGHPVRFYTYFGKRIEGVLISVEGGVVRVAERVNRGVAEYPVELDKLQSMEVYR